jgi:vacuolar-type H+-ATPase catalytic subunit A/Vma1
MLKLPRSVVVHNKILNQMFELAQAVKLSNRTTCIPKPFGCGKKITTEFRDKLSETEFSISGLCQECQDIVFAEPTD